MSSFCVLVLAVCQCDTRQDCNEFLALTSQGQALHYYMYSVLCDVRDCFTCVVEQGVLCDV